MGAELQARQLTAASCARDPELILRSSKIKLALVQLGGEAITACAVHVLHTPADHGELPRWAAQPQQAAWLGRSSEWQLLACLARAELHITAKLSSVDQPWLMTA